MRLRIIATLAGFLACDPGPSSTANWPGTNSPSSTGAATSGESGSPACGKNAAKGVIPKKVTINGKSRSYTLVVPAAYTPHVSQPLIYVLHGHGGTGVQARSSFDLEGPSGGKALFLYPDGIGGGWDLDTETGKNRDVAFFDAMLAQVQSEYCIDLHRVFIAGFSNGAYMANQLACRRSERVRAVATHSGGGPYDGSAGAKYDDHGHLQCGPKPVGALVLHGTADGTVAPSEGQKSIDHWVSANHCSSPTASGACATYANCINPVVACKVPGLGHSVWAEGPKRAWSFFDAQR
jgi:polyhydroxybutyrate depolymerase